MSQSVRLIALTVALACLLPAAARSQSDNPAARPPFDASPGAVENGSRVGRVAPPGETARQAGHPAAASPVPAAIDVEQMLAPSGMSATIKVMLLLTVLSLAPSILIMTTCFIRFVVVLGLLRQALGTQQLPPNQVIVSICLFLTFLVMAPVWQRAYHEGIVPYTNPPAGAPSVTLEQAFHNASRPLRNFMIDQIEATGNSDAVLMLLDFQNQRTDGDLPDAAEPDEQFYDDVPLTVLLPAFMLSELKTAFIIGFQLYLPFVVIDMIISSLLISMGMMMLPPVLISLPFKLLLFVLIDGWYLTVGMLLESVQPFG